jgi:hypothetical protein
MLVELFCLGLHLVHRKYSPSCFCAIQVLAKTIEGEKSGDSVKPFCLQGDDWHYNRNSICRQKDPK